MNHLGILPYIVFLSSGVLGENQKKFVLFMLRAVMYSAPNHGYRDCREAATHHTRYKPRRPVTYTLGSR